MVEERESDWALEKRKYPWMDETSLESVGMFAQVT